MPLPARHGDRVLHVTQPTTAGVAACVLALAHAQQAAGLEVHVACPVSEGRLAGALAGSDTKDRSRITVHPWAADRTPGPSLGRELRDLRQTIAAVAPDVVHLHSAKAGLAGRLLIRGRRPTVFQPHAWSFDAVDGPVRAATLRWERLAARWTSLLLCVSDDELTHGRRNRVHAPSVVVPNGVDLDVLSVADAGDRVRARSVLALDGAAPLAVCVGRLARQKGQDVLLAAWRDVTRAVPAARLVLVGDGPDADALRRSAPPGVDFAGERQDIPLWLAAANVVVVPSRWEGMALVPLEAMARARSVVASAVSGVAESVPAGAGQVVAPEDVPALVAALVNRLQALDVADAEGLVGRAHVERRHDLRRTTVLTTQAYARLTSPPT